MQKYRINQQITAQEIILIDSENNNVGKISTTEALIQARSAGLDLVEVSPKSNPPVCKILDYGQWIYSQTKQKQKGKSHRTEIKGIRLTYNMGTHDLNVRIKQAQKFLNQGHRVKAEIMLKGRQKAHPEKVEETLLNFQKMLGDKIKVEQAPKREGHKYSALYSLNKK